MRWQSVAVLGACLVGIGCTGGSDPRATREPPESEFFRVIIPRQDGVVDTAPAYEAAATHCGERLQSSVFFMAQDIGPSERMLYFRCE